MNVVRSANGVLVLNATICVSIQSVFAVTKQYILIFKITAVPNLCEKNAQSKFS